MKPEFKNWLNANKGAYHFSFDFIENSPALKGHSAKQKVLNIMVGSDYAMNGIVKWTRLKYQALANCGLSTVREVFDYLISIDILIPIEGTSNYNLDFSYLQRRLANTKPFPRMRKTSVPQDTKCVPQDTECVPQDTECVPQDQHTDRTDILNKKISVTGEEDDILSSSPSQTQKKPITEHDILDLIQYIDI